MVGEAENTSRNSNMFSNPTLYDLNDDELEKNIGVIIFIGILMILGLLGNINTIFIYLNKYKPSNYRTFILCLAIVDLATCCFSMPVSLITLRFPLMFPYDKVCQGFWFLTYSMCIGSSFILVTIAADRYRKICVPHGAQLSVRMAKYICILVLLLASAFSWPCIILFGNKRYEIPKHNVNGTGCYYNDEFRNTNYPAKYNYFLLFILLVTFVALLLIYVLIGKRLLHIKGKGRSNIQLSEQTEARHMDIRNLDNTDNSSTTESQKTSVARHHMTETSEVSTCLSSPDGAADMKPFQCKQDKTRIPPKQVNRKKLSKLKGRRSVTIIKILLIMTIVSFVSFLPNLILSIITLEHDDFLTKLSFTETSVYQIFYFCFYINNVAFPIIYGLCDTKFSKETRKLYSIIVPPCFKGY
ncbi:hypothetical protein ACJMK2_012055 [Sinanodonta woodiana]|uniref:G-protein coupled receptors family 1 profile domain-containing protein n=1 Tax=Sinanodonta woodiana TaxID=1069815 RepID=A0ABD3VA07_SINWO